VQGHAVLRESGRIDDRAIGAVDVLVQLVDERTLVIGREDDQLDPKLLCQLLQLGLDFRQRCRAVDVRLAASEQVEVGSVQDEYSHASPLLWARPDAGQTGTRSGSRLECSGNLP
jgi:hypothetical protein